MAIQVNNLCGGCKALVQDINPVMCGKGHPFHELCGVTLATANPTNLRCPVCKIEMEPHNFLTKLDLEVSQRMYHSQQESDKKLAHTLQGQFEQEHTQAIHKQIASDEALAQDLQYPPRCSDKCYSVAAGVIALAIPVAYIAIRHFIL